MLGLNFMNAGVSEKKEMRMWLEISVLVAAGLAVSVGAAAEDIGGDAYVRADTASLPDAKWVLGTSRMERTLTLAGGRFLLTSFLNKATNPPKEYVQTGASPEFSAMVNGEICSGAKGGWNLDTWSTENLPQGENSREF